MEYHKKHLPLHHLLSSLSQEQTRALDRVWQELHQLQQTPTIESTIPLMEYSTKLHLPLCDLANSLIFHVAHERNEDLVQECVIGVLLNLEKFKGKSRFSTWAWRVMSNVVRGYLRKTIPRRNREVSLESLDTSSFHSLSENDLATCYQLKDALYKVMDKLPNRRRQVVKLRLCGYSFEEIARKLDVTVSTATDHWSTAIKSIKESNNAVEQEDSPERATASDSHNSDK